MSIKDYQNGFALGKACKGATGVKEKPLPLCEIDNEYMVRAGNYTDFMIYPNDYPSYISLPNGTTGFAKLHLELQHSWLDEDALGAWYAQVKLTCVDANGTFLEDILVFSEMFWRQSIDVNITRNISVDLATFPSGTAKFYPYYMLKDSNGNCDFHQDEGHIKISNIRVEEED